jgi:hypothetical protein
MLKSLPSVIVLNGYGNWSMSISLLLKKSSIILMLKDISWLSEVKNLPVWECAKRNGRLRLTAKQAFGEHNGKQVARWVKTTENYLLDGNIKQVGKRIRKLKKVNPAFRE